MGEVDEIVADNDSEYDEILDATIMYKTDRTYPSNSLKDIKRAIQKRAELLKIVKRFIFSKKEGKAESQNHH